MGEYALVPSEQEMARYRMMAEQAAETEADDWAAAGIRPGAAVADVGCGPGAILKVLAETVGDTGSVVGVDADPAVVELARAEIAGLAGATVQGGDAAATGLPTASFDVVMCRHVLAHNGPRERDIVSHLASLIRPGGFMYLVDILGDGYRTQPQDTLSEEIHDRYRAFHHQRGNDLNVGIRLGDLLEGAGLEVERYRCGSPVFRIPPGIRSPAWAARDAMLRAGVVTEADLERWDRAMTEADGGANGAWMFVPTFIAIGRRPS